MSWETQEEARADGEDAEPPYLGLARFGTGDEERFFGRERLVARLVELVRERRLVVLTGPSGSGKSSLLRAGLIPGYRGAPSGLRPPCGSLRRVLAPRTTTGTSATRGRARWWWSTSSRRSSPSAPTVGHDRTVVRRLARGGTYLQEVVRDMMESADRWRTLLS
ncbi:hypothetical protein [Streptomyces sp. NPDC046371]|uniref:ATP-binding protein n=1 Tax=unclassified Streptomyces TaxID=2593676 RepID=UPI0033FB5364